MKCYRPSTSILLLIIISAWFSNIKAQQVDTSFVLDSNQTGTTKEFIARDYIRLTPGFIFSASQSSSFKGSIDPCLLFPPTENTYALPNGTITENPLQGAVVGSIPGQFAVSPTGAATYTIPIECPPGINGMQPTIALVYNSQAGNGLAGWGWNLSGLSSITVVPKTIFSNNEVKSLDLTEQLQLQTFALDGNRLILKSVAAGIKNYVTENKTYVKIINDDSKFVVTTKDGVVMEYARQCIPHKVLTSQITPGPYMWLLTKVTDSNGNYVLYHYTTNSNNTQTVLDKVEYTGNGSILPTLKIEFDYDVKTEVKKQYIGGYYCEDLYLLNNIIVKSASHQLRKYELSHVQSGDKNLLSAVNLCGENSEKLNATTIEWGANNEVIDVNTITLSPYSGDVTYRIFSSGDVDGDGISDVIEYYRQNSLSQLSDNVRVHKMKFENGNIVYDQTILNKILPAATLLDYKDWIVVNSIGPLAGFNGSQKKTVLIPCFEDGPGGVSFDLLDAKSYLPINCPLEYTSCKPEFVIGDINNDGIDEIIVIEKTNNDNPATPDYQNGSIFYIKKKNLLTEALDLQDSLIVEPLSFDSR
ncbi:MAG: SpvB/TcaC N-terminal domain-containing protein, partial [Bacteroidales bacterium]